MCILDRIYLTHQESPLTPKYIRENQARSLKITSTWNLSQKKPKKILKTSVPMQNKNPFQIKILRKKNQKSFKLTPLQSIFYLCQFSLNLLKFRISKRQF